MSVPADSLPQPQLTPAQRQVFAEDGFLIMRQLASVERIAALRSLALAHADRRVVPIEYEADVAYPGAPASREAEGGDTPRRLLQAHDRDPLLADWTTDARLTAIVAQLLDSERVWLSRNHHNCVMTKHPRFSTATAWHRDLRYWAFETPRLVNAWLALGDERPDNGGMRLLPGTHRMRFDADAMDADQFLREDVPRNRELIASAVEATLDPGDVLLFDAGTLHAAGANATDELKLSVVTTYYGADNAPVPGTRSAQRPPMIAREPDHA
ncbi:phytanoyl-CoA dioxygenase family protein [Salinisphaera orenii]|uniref:Phytanoyl-CoA dioxygenase n=1 Tax=Salinisphaera orenii YIM 95161 TaxID=1051139 RepID=A0A423PPB5_9GAMM|nr:phytanoyl-CoA dioxygenase family protein [Salinisphaera halophila]ROO27466.1 phytanoyl-CoA dioxygenase [Salinisphaera halophila YIM 95161]